MTAWRRTSLPRALLVLLTGSLLSVGCPATRGPAPHRDETVADTTRLRELREAVEQQLGTPTCTDRSQCRAMPVGAKPCGGPSSYVVYSMATTDSVRLAAVVQEYTAYQADLNRKQELVSDCQFLSAPPVDCMAGACAARSGIPSRD
jgi:hypothetical protein